MCPQIRCCGCHRSAVLLSRACCSNSTCHRGRAPREHHQNRPCISASSSPHRQSCRAQSFSIPFRVSALRLFFQTILQNGEPLMPLATSTIGACDFCTQVCRRCRWVPPLGSQIRHDAADASKVNSLAGVGTLFAHRYFLAPLLSSNAVLRRAQTCAVVDSADPFLQLGVRANCAATSLPVRQFHS